MEDKEMFPKSRAGPPSGERSDCVWKQAGVVRRKECARGYQCRECVFDRALRRAARENRERKEDRTPGHGRRRSIILWQERLMERPQWQRPCIHHMKGHIEYRSCTNEYQCGPCDFNQYFLDQFTVHAAVLPVETFEVKGIKLPQGYYFHPGHTWVRMEGDSSVRVGIDDFVFRLLGPLDRIEGPLAGKEVRQGSAAISVFRGSRKARMLSPVTGVVTSINPAVWEGPGPAGSPYTEGWVMLVHAYRLREDLRNLFIHEETKAFMEGEVARLYELIETVEGPLSADGGLLGDDILGKIPKLGWDNLQRLFLRHSPSES